MLSATHKSDDHQLAYTVLDWENTKYDEIDIKTVDDESGEVEETSINIKEFGNFDIIIAAEVIYWEQSIIPLMTIVDKMFTNNSDSLVFYMVFMKRSQRLYDQLLEAYEKYGLEYEIIDDPLTHEAGLYYK